LRDPGLELVSPPSMRGAGLVGASEALLEVKHLGAQLADLLEIDHCIALLGFFGAGGRGLRPSPAAGVLPCGARTTATSAEVGRCPSWHT